MVNILHTVDWDLRWYDFLHIMLDCYNWMNTKGTKNLFILTWSMYVERHYI